MKFKFLLAAFFSIPFLSGCGFVNPQNVPVEYVEITEHRMEVELGNVDTISYAVYPENATNKDVNWNTSNEEIVYVSPTGNIYAASVGLATITVSTVDGDKSDSCIVRVYDQYSVTGIKFDINSMDLNIGETKFITPTIEPSSARNKAVKWSTSNPNVAKIENGKVTALKKGTANITATTIDGEYSAICVVNVSESGEVPLWDTTQDELRKNIQTLDLYSFNDTHGSTSENGDEPGINLLSSYVKQRKEMNPDGFALFSAGDMWQGSADSNITRGRLMIDWMNLLDFSAMALGNHEFDWTIDTIKYNMTEANFPMLACNIVETSTNKNVDWVEPYTTITRNGVHIGVIGAIGEGITSSILASNVKGLKFADEDSYIISWADYLRSKGADVVVVLVHNGVSSIGSEAAKHIDAIFGGHSHAYESKTIGGVPAVQASCNGKAMGHIQIQYDFSSNEVSFSGGEYLDTKTSTLKNAGITADSETVDMYNYYLETEIAEVKNEVVCTYTGGIAQKDIPYIYDTYAYCYYCETVPAVNQKQVSFIWTNQARSKIYANSKGITYGDLYKALPFDNALELCYAYGKDLKTISSYGYYLEPSGESTSWSALTNSFNDGTLYYFLAIDYIVESEYYVGKIHIEDTFREEEALPRNIMKRYISGYPDNVIF